jgi:hypothetical protein
MRALRDQAATFELDILGRRYSQAPFRYQGKCYDALCKKLTALPREVRVRLDPLLERTGCLSWLT